MSNLKRNQRIPIEVHTAKNLTSSVTIFDLHASHNSKKPVVRVEVIDFHDDGFSIEVPPNICKKGNSVLITLTIHATEKMIPFEATTKVVEHDDSGDETTRLVLKLVQYDKDTWAEIFKLLNDRQNTATHLFGRVKG